MKNEEWTEDWFPVETSIRHVTCLDELCGCEQTEYTPHKTGRCSNCKGLGKKWPEYAIAEDSLPFNLSAEIPKCQKCAGTGKACYLTRDANIRGTIVKEVPGKCQHEVKWVEGKRKHPWQVAPVYFREASHEEMLERYGV